MLFLFGQKGLNYIPENYENNASYKTFPVQLFPYKKNLFQETKIATDLHIRTLVIITLVNEVLSVLICRKLIKLCKVMLVVYSIVGI